MKNKNDGSKCKQCEKSKKYPVECHGYMCPVLGYDSFVVRFHVPLDHHVHTVLDLCKSHLLVKCVSEWGISEIQVDWSDDYINHDDIIFFKQVLTIIYKNVHGFSMY